MHICPGVVVVGAASGGVLVGALAGGGAGALVVGAAAEHVRLTLSHEQPAVDAQVA